MKKDNITPSMRQVVGVCNTLAAAQQSPAAAMELNDGRIVTGKTSALLGASAALLLNAVKELAGIPHEIHVIAPSAIEPIQTLKTRYLGSHNPRLHTDEVLIALSISATTNPLSHLAMQQRSKLKDCDVHSSVILSEVDSGVFRKLNMHLTCEDLYQSKSSLYHIF